ncbi:MAG: hypothetical protein IH966_08090, partial [Gemmatimonadetes bacterium]|nr:hypothetical protein [Gemmatimonadota bacterium]
MVRLRSWLDDERGATRTGCLFLVLVVVAVVYFGLPIGGMYIRYYRMENEMRTQARFAPSIDNGTIQRRLLQTVDALGLPLEASRRLRIVRTRRPREIVISTTWEETIVLPF